MTDEARIAQQQLLEKRKALGLTEEGIRPGLRRLGEALKNALTSLPSPSKEEATHVCDRCGQTVEPVQENLLGITRWRPRNCPACLPVIMAEDEQRKQQVEVERRLRRYETTFPLDVSARLKTVTLEDFDVRAGTEKAVWYAKSYAAGLPEPDPCGLVIWGPTGNGKTHLAAAIANAARQHQMAVAWIHTPGWLRYIGTLESDIREEQIRMACRADLLVLDELGGGKLTASRSDWLLSLLDTVYRQNRNLIATTNLNPDELVIALTPMRDDGSELEVLDGERIVDRLTEVAVFVSNEATSFRAELARRRRQEREGTP